MGLNIVIISRWFCSCLSMIFIVCLLACGGRGNDDNTTADKNDDTSAETGIVGMAVSYPVGFDPLKLARERTEIVNLEAVIPSQCYTKTEGISNPCYTCHTSVNARNEMADKDLQKEYAFSDFGLENHWKNLFEDRSADMAAITDEESLRYVRQDNYQALREHLQSRDDYTGWVPDLKDLAAARTSAFDEEGFAKDGSWWRAFRYKPFPGTFWPTNGSTDDVMIRLAAAFYHDATGKPSREIYKLNLAILEAALASPDNVQTKALNRLVEPVDETILSFDLNGNGVTDPATTRINQLPDFYAGGASDIAVQRFLYPQGTEFLHTVRYIDPDQEDLISQRMKEVRYSRKELPMSLDRLRRTYVAELEEKDMGNLPVFIGSGEVGLINNFSWRLQGFIENENGHLRVQTEEETLFCMGCHSTIGITADQTFAFPRKVPGINGWGYQNLVGIKDVPQAGKTMPETLEYFQRVKGGDEFRANKEVLALFFEDGNVREREVLRAASGGDKDLRYLVTPSRERALALNKAYMALVSGQDFELGRDPVPEPATRVFEFIGENGTTDLGDSGQVYDDGRIWLEWE